MASLGGSLCRQEIVQIHGDQHDSLMISHYACIDDRDVCYLLRILRHFVLPLQSRISHRIRANVKFACSRSLCTKCASMHTWLCPQSANQRKSNPSRHRRSVRSSIVRHVCETFLSSCGHDGGKLIMLLCQTNNLPRTARFRDVPNFVPPTKFPPANQSTTDSHVGTICGPHKEKRVVMSRLD